MMPQFFHHHQIDLAQRDGLKINLFQLSPESLLLILIADYAENYTHLAQVCSMLCISIHTLHTNLLINEILNTFFFYWVVDESDALVPQIVLCHTHHPSSLLGL